jgi:hypothetical protein
MAYLDNAGLYRKYGTEKTAANKVGEYRTDGANRIIEIKGLDLTTLVAGDAIISDTLFFPKNWILERAEIWTKTAATTASSATLNVGVIDLDRTSNLDEDAILDNVAIADMNADGEYNQKVGPAADTGLGVVADKDTVLTAPKYITAGTSTGTYTAGVIDIRLHIRPLV